MIPLLEARSVAEKIVRYRKSYRSFATEQLRVSGKPLKFWECQIPLVDSVERQLENRGFVRQVWLKGRQVGGSTLAESFVSWRTMLWPNVNAIVIADEAERSRSLFEISKMFYEQMDDDIRPRGRYVTKRELVFANPSVGTRLIDPGLHSRIVVDSAHKKNIAIGANWQIAHLSEAARFRDSNFVLDGVIPAVHRVPGTFIIIESTAEKSGTWFRDFCDDAMKGRNAFEFSFVPWYLHPEYFICPVCHKSYPNSCIDPEHITMSEKMMSLGAEERHIMIEFGLKHGHIRWMREKLAEMGNDWDLFRQNFPLTPDDAWITPGAQAFPMRKLREQRDNMHPPDRLADVFPGPRVLDAIAGKLWIWKEPEKGKAYDIGCDVSMGLAKEEDDDDVDGSAICVVERGSCDQVAEWYSKKVDPLELATTLYWLGLYYNTAQIAVETNAGMGGATNAQLSKMGYSNIYLWRYRDEAVPRYSKKTGWESNRRTKPWLVGFAVHELINSRVKIRSELLLREMESYVRHDESSWGAVAGRNDDRVVAWMIAVLVSDDEDFSRYYGLQREMNARTTDNDKKLMPEPWQADLSWLKKDVDKLDSPWD